MAQHRRLPGRDRGCARVRPVLHRAGDRGRQGASGEGAGGRGRGGRAGGHRRGRVRWARSCGPPTRGRRSPTRSTSLGGEYLAISSPEVEVSTTGYAKEMGEDYKAREAQLYAEQCATSTSSSPPRSSPAGRRRGIITAEMVASMKPGSVIVDMAAANGGNVAGTVAGEKIVTSERCHDHRLHRPGGPVGRAGEPALRHQPGQPDEAAHPGQGRPAGAGLRRRRPALDDRGARRREDLAATAGVGVGRPEGGPRDHGGRQGRRARQGRQGAHVRGRAGTASSPRPGSCCSGSPRCRRPR